MPVYLLQASRGQIFLALLPNRGKAVLTRV
jgi:hypothetical protein